jgi:SagB-type dehydrogenase family enzyme
VPIILAVAVCLCAEATTQPLAKPLPQPRLDGEMSVEQALQRRRSLRRYSGQPLNAAQIGQLCWAAQGISDRQRGLRTCPSAGATYPLELYVVTAAGVDSYRPQGHTLSRQLDGDYRERLKAAAMSQASVGSAPVVFVIAAVPQRTQAKYGQRAIRYVWAEAGHACQNLLLEATAMELRGVPVGAFDDDEVAKVLSLPPDRSVLYLVPIGVSAK